MLIVDDPVGHLVVGLAAALAHLGWAPTAPMGSTPRPVDETDRILRVGPDRQTVHVAPLARVPEYVVSVDFTATYFVDRDQPFLDLLSELQHILGEGGSAEDAAQRTRLLAAVARGVAAVASLSPRESAVAAHILRGRSATEIARIEFVSLSTVRAQIRSILVRLGAGSQIEAVALVHRYASVGVTEQARRGLRRFEGSR